MSSDNFIKKITSKDAATQKDALKELISSKDGSLFLLLCENCDFIFPFVKEKIINEFVTLVNKDDLDVVFEYSKIYCCDFEDLIVKSWLKFADEDLTDKILDIFQHGETEQKTYCAKYFQYIKDTLCIDCLKEGAKSDFLPLKTNCAKALNNFGESEYFTDMMNVVLNSNDEFEVLSAFEFIGAYGGDKALEFTLKHGLECSFASNIVSNLLNFNDFNTIRKKSSDEALINTFCTLLEAYPEDIGLETILYYQIYDFILEILKINSQYARNALITAREKFDEFAQNNVYLFDLEKNTVNEIKNISAFLNKQNLSVEGLLDELDMFCNKRRYNIAINVVRIVKDEKCFLKIAELINELKLLQDLMATSVMLLKECGCTGLVNREIVKMIDNENIKALIESCLN